MSRLSPTRTVNRTTATVFYMRYVVVFMAYLLVGSASVAQAQGSTPLREANRIYETGDIDGALVAYERALQAAGNATRDVLHIHRRLGHRRAELSGRGARRLPPRPVLGAPARLVERDAARGVSSARVTTLPERFHPVAGI